MSRTLRESEERIRGREKERDREQKREDRRGNRRWWGSFSDMRFTPKVRMHHKYVTYIYTVTVPHTGTVFVWTRTRFSSSLRPPSAPRSRLAISSHRRDEMQAWPEHKSLNLVQLFSTAIALLLLLLLLLPNSRNKRRLYVDPSYYLSMWYSKLERI